MNHHTRGEKIRALTGGAALLWAGKVLGEARVVDTGFYTNVIGIGVLVLFTVGLYFMEHPLKLKKPRQRD